MNRLLDDAVRLASVLQERATALQTPHERRQQAELDRMLQTPADKVTLVQLTDQAFRSRTAARTAEHLTHILDVQGVPRFFSPLDRALLRGFKTFGGFLPGVAVPLVKEHMQQETANVVLPAEHPWLGEHLQARRREGVRMNLNLLGEAVLGEDEAMHRLQRNLEVLQSHEVEVISVKISTLFSQISAIARRQTLRVLCDRLELLYRTAAHLRFTRPDGSQVPKFVYLDMEEYRDLQLTAEAFMRTLERPGLQQVSGGIALQAYIPDSARVHRDLNAWARARVEKGGAPITVRLVKGANMEAERVDAVLHDWPQAPFLTKRETDANFKWMLREAMRPENLAAVRVGVASHNLFDLAYGVVLAAAQTAGDRVQFEMLEGMANHQRRALLEQTRNLLLYAPACRKEEFLNAIGYLIRRLDENTGEENFLRHAFRLRVGSPEWQHLEAGFRESFTLQVSDEARRKQNRAAERHDSALAEMDWRQFRNEPDTDWSLPHNSTWAEQIVNRAATPVPAIPLVIGGDAIEPGDRSFGSCLDPSRPGAEVTRFAQATREDIDSAVDVAIQDRDGWRSRSVEERNSVLGLVASELRKARADLLWAALINGGKVLTESDPEVSEAVDFVEFYRASARSFFERSGEAAAARATPRGVVAVIPPWNFPIAIPCGGVAAALAAGNTVLLKPASATVLVAWEFCQCFWRAGVPRTALQFVPCTGDTAQHLATHRGVDAVILTGGTATALHLLNARPGMRLFAETGGKNASIITALSDRELAIKHVVHSAFSHSGQKCSASSLLLLEGEVYDDPEFKRMLCDAISSLQVGSAWDLATRVGPLIRPPAGDLERSLKTLEPGESWAVLPRQVGDNPAIWSPGLKYGVQPGSFTHQTELFGPVLGVMRFQSLDQAIHLVNQTGYGLTSALHSLDEREHAQWVNGIQAGNLYVNRGTTGAIVLRQPFGGMGRSCFGPGMKAGGPNYVAQFMSFTDVNDGDKDGPVPPSQRLDRDGSRAKAAQVTLGGALVRTSDTVATEQVASLEAGIECGDGHLSATERRRLLIALDSYQRWWRDEFSAVHDSFRLLGQDNFRRYLSFSEIRIRVGVEDQAFDVIARAAAARVTGARVIISQPPDVELHSALELERLTESWAGAIEFVEETDEDLAAWIRILPPHANERIRYATPDRVPAGIRSAATAAGVTLADEPVLADGRIELLWYLREQSISSDYHRYGNLGIRAQEERRGPG